MTTEPKESTLKVPRPNPAPEPSLTAEEVVGMAHEKSVSGKERKEHYEAAKAALDAVNAGHLFQLYEQVARDRSEGEKALMTTIELALKRSDKPLSQQQSPPADAIAAMERVALAAIELAKQIVEKS